MASTTTMFRASLRQLSIKQHLDSLIHPPLPLTQRQSQELLQLLTTSFRKQLDAEHGKLPSNSSSHKSIPSKSEIVQSTLSSRQRNTDTLLEGMNTDRHMQRLLNNPLFSDRPVHKHISRDPMDVFEAAVARGMMDLDHAANCLAAKKLQIENSSVLDIRDGMRESKAGTTTLKWLISSGNVNDFGFLRHKKLSINLMQFMVAEGLHDICWSWVRKLFSAYMEATQGVESRHTKNNLRIILISYIRALARDHASLDEVYIIISKAFDYYKQCSVAGLESVMDVPISLAIVLTKSASHGRPPSTSTHYNAFLKTIQNFRPHYDPDLAHLHLLHPTSPSADLALELIRQVHKIGPPQSDELIEQELMEQASSEKTSRVSGSKQKAMDMRFMDMALDAAKFLLQNNRSAEANEAMECLKLHFSRQLGLSPKQQDFYEDSKAEVASLEALGRVSFG